MSLELAIEQAVEHGLHAVGEYRPAEPTDVHFDSLTDSCWEWLDEWLVEHEGFAWEDGGACMDCMMGTGDPIRDSKWHNLRKAIAEVITEHGDFDEAAWQESRTLTLGEAREMLAKAELREGGQQ